MSPMSQQQKTQKQAGFHFRSRQMKSGLALRSVCLSTENLLVEPIQNTMPTSPQIKQFASLKHAPSCSNSLANGEKTAASSTVKSIFHPKRLSIGYKNSKSTLTRIDATESGTKRFRLPSRLEQVKGSNTLILQPSKKPSYLQFSPKLSSILQLKKLPKQSSTLKPRSVLETNQKLSQRNLLVNSPTLTTSKKQANFNRNSAFLTQL